MKVLLINGSPNEHGNTFQAFSEAANTLNATEDGHPQQEQSVWTNFIK